MRHSAHKKGIYAGVWDLLHPGHLHALQWAKKHCSHLTVAVNRHPTIDNPKKQEPIESEGARVLRLQACSLADTVVTYTGEAGLQALYETGEYDVAFISEEHRDTHTPTHHARPIFVPKLSKHSSTTLRTLIYEHEKEKRKQSQDS